MSLYAARKIKDMLLWAEVKFKETQYEIVKGMI